jgi:glycosyltransferase involved in cell wall biosynthesis
MQMDFANLESLLKAIEPSTSIVDHVSTKEKVKFLLVGTHAHQFTGYSKVTYNLIKELSKCEDLDVYHFAFQKFSEPPKDWRPLPHNVKVYDVFANEKIYGKHENGFGFSLLPDYVKLINPSYVMIYNDATVICNYLDMLETKLTPEERSSYKILTYFDQVYEFQRPQLLSRIDKDTHTYFAFTNYWKSILQSYGISKEIFVLNHGFDSSEFKQLDKKEIRKKHGVPDDLFVFLNLNRNTPRKRYDILVMAFAQLVVRHPTQNVALMCVCDAGEQGGYPLMEIFAHQLSLYKVPIESHMHKLLIVKDSMSFTDEMINELYCLSDVGISTADGEGFGLCQFEAMGLGIPQIVPYVGGFKDFCFDKMNSLCVQPKLKVYSPISIGGISGMCELCDYKDVCIAMEDYMLDSELCLKHGKASKETIEKYIWSSVVKDLVDVLIHKK